jgi:AcrR family transcriptional regulator
VDVRRLTPQVEAVKSLERIFSSGGPAGRPLSGVQGAALAEVAVASNRQKPTKDRHTEILDAAAKVITDRGLAETRISDIAERAGVSPGLILYYFESKDRLLSDALTHVNDRYYLQMSRELRRIDSAREQLERLIDLSVPGLLPEFDRLEEWALWIEVWVRALRDPEMAKEREVLDRRWRDAISDIIRHGQEAGEFPAEGDADELALRLSCMMDGLAIQVIMNDSAVPPDRMKRTCMEVAANEIGFAFDRAEAP